MRKKTSHESKTPSQRNLYHEYIGRKESEPTIDEKVDFRPSNEVGEELAIPTEGRKRKVPFNDRISDYISNHWLETLFAAIIAILGIFAITTQVDIAVIQANISSQNQTINDNKSTFTRELDSHQRQLDLINSKIVELTDFDHIQDLLMNELKLRIEYLEK